MLPQKSDVGVTLGLSSLKCNIIKAEHPPRPLLVKLARELHCVTTYVIVVLNLLCYLFNFELMLNEVVPTNLLDMF